jgi:putative ATPase
MPDVSWYHPTDRGLEARIAERLAELRALDAKAREGKD